MNFNTFNLCWPAAWKSVFHVWKYPFACLLIKANGGGYLSHNQGNADLSLCYSLFLDDIFIVFRSIRRMAGMLAWPFHTITLSFRGRMRNTFLSAGHDHTMREDVPIRREMSVESTMTSRRNGRFPYHLLSFPGMAGASRRTYDLFPSRQNIFVRSMITSRRSGRFPYGILSSFVATNDSRRAYAPFLSHERKPLSRCYDHFIFQPIKYQSYVTC